jgi:uncharacterized membrane protein YphA (DoxX/SURF4 family)
VSGALLPGLLAAGSLLVAAGVAKLRRPATAARFLASLGLRAPYLLVCVGALLEVMAGGALLLWPRAAAAGMALLFLLFALLVAAQLRRPASVPCGCVGARAMPLSGGHLCLNLVGLLLCAAAVAAPPPSYVAILAADPPAAAAAGVAGVVVAFLATSALELFPQTMRAWGGVEA